MDNLSAVDAAKKELCEIVSDKEFINEDMPGRILCQINDHIRCLSDSEGMANHNVDKLTKRVELLEGFLSMDKKFPITDILTLLLGAADKLLDDRGYDGDGWEMIDEARKAGNASMKALKAVK